ncbi:hypothetical protein DL96DRAFT_1582155 [Flagelloscypha sp. PMI_526]|nr:hypothetical protein DL96DRAFT_1582155 [Flagelloscypha sp. PMI_526]
MDEFEDANPFGNDSPETASSPSAVNVSVPGSPQAVPSHFSPPPNVEQQLFAEPSAPLSPPREVQGIDKADFCCARDRDIHSSDDFEIYVTDAQKTTVSSTSPYIVYVIQTGTAEARHRYSEFEAFRQALVKLYPTLIVPPIPGKQTIGDYAIKQGKAKEDAAMISRRRRMLQKFLNRLVKHPILSNDHVFHRFLDGQVSWGEIATSPPLSLLPKNILKAPSHDPTDQEASPAYQALPNPSAAHPLRNPDQRFLDSEAFTHKFASHLSGPLEKVTRRTIRRWSDMSQDYADLGAALNGFSLNEQDPLSGAIEKTGQAIDATYMSTTKLVQQLEQRWAEPLHEYTQFASIIKKLLAYRHQKHVQYEMTQESLETKKDSLEDMEKSEAEAKRLESALSRGRLSRSEPSTSAISPSVSGGEAAGGEGENVDVDAEASGTTSEPSGVGAGQRNSSYLPPHPGPSPARRRSRPPGSGFLSALSYTISGMMDVDPETARRNGITKTRESISQLEDALHLAAQDLKYSSSTIQADLDRFQRMKVRDLKFMTIEMAQAHREWCKKNLEAWEEAKREINNLPEHPNRIPPEELAALGAAGEAEDAGPSLVNNRRDSTTTLNGR